MTEVRKKIRIMAVNDKEMDRMRKLVRGRRKRQRKRDNEGHYKVRQ